MSNRTPDFIRGAKWALQQVWDVLPIQDDEPSAYMVHQLKHIADKLPEHPLKRKG